MVVCPLNAYNCSFRWVNYPLPNWATSIEYSTTAVVRVAAAGAGAGAGAVAAAAAAAVGGAGADDDDGDFVGHYFHS